MPKYTVKVSYLETNYVERDIVVEASNEREARKLARQFNTSHDKRIKEVGEESCCEPQKSWRYRVVEFLRHG